ncbi:MAG TPA: LON peptidase substrate-binding domain-containing protein [Acidimicrobiales bacterium]|nr:LON peptidase substrate-binding domain-containing protein [Acidimicrobiales bacterium]
MFPLGTVLLPGMVLPLQVFEPRYLQLVADVAGSGDEFGVVLIERGSEVGGGDVRTDVGTVARIMQREDLPDGRALVAAVGARRIRVERWLDDDPYPRAEVADWPDEAPPPDGGARRAALQVAVRHVAALRTELAEPAPPVDIELVEDPVLGVYEAMLVALPGAADRQALLATPTVAERAARLITLLAEEAEVLEARLGGR